MSEVVVEKGEWPASELPLGWSWASFDDVFHNVTHNERKLKQTEYAKCGLFPVIDQGAALVGGYTDNDNLLHPLDPPFIVFGDHTRCAKFVPFRFVQGADGVKVLRPVAFAPKFAYLALQAIRLPNKGYSRHFQFLRNSQFPVAPLKEQQRIIDKVEELLSDLDAGVSALERATANLKRYRAAVLKAAVTGELTTEWRAAHLDVEPASAVCKRIETPPRPARYASRSKDIIPGHPALSVGPTGAKLPPGWTWCPLVDVARMESGHTPSRNHPEWWDGDIPWVGILDAKAHHGGTINETLQHTNEEGLANSAARLLPTGTVCISRTAASIGYVMVLGRPMATSQDFVNWVPTEAVRSDWLRVIFMVDREVLVRFGKGSTHKTVYFPEWLSLHIAVPPLAEQEAIAVEVERRLSVIAVTADYVAASLKRAGRLRQSILNEAFAGQLLPQDPSDEPASVLLDRIRQAQTIAGDSGPGRPSRARRKLTSKPTTTEASDGAV